MITIARGQKGIIAIYKDGELVTTHDKHCRPDDIELSVETHGGGKVKEVTGDFDTFDKIPVTLKGLKD